MSLSEQTKGGLSRVALLVAASVAAMLVISSFVSNRIGGYDYVPGDVATRTIRAPRDLFFEDVQSTERKRAEAGLLSKRVFIIDDREERFVPYQLNLLFEGMREIAGQPDGVEHLALGDEQRMKFERKFNVDFEGEEWAAITDKVNWPLFTRILSKALNPIIERGVVSDEDIFSRGRSRRSSTLIHKSSNQEQPLVDLGGMLSLKQAREVFGASLADIGVEAKPAFRSALVKLGDYVLRPNVTFNAEESEHRLKVLRERVSPIYNQVKKGEVIVRAGDVVSPSDARKLERLRENHGGEKFVREALGYFVITALIFIVTYHFAQAFWQAFSLSLRDLTAVVVTLICSLLILRLFQLFSDAFNLNFPDIESNAFMLCAPVAAGGMLLQVTLGASAVFLFTMSFSLLTAIFLEDPWKLMLIIALGNCIGAIFVKRCTRRATLLNASLRVAVTNIIVVLSYLVILPEVTLQEGSAVVLLAIAGGVLSGIVAAGLLPVLEYLGGYATDIRLLELASLERPLLRELSLQAPGTWNHSMVVGHLGEVAAESIGANSLLTKVGAYYHDIGKARKPVYFIENQGGGTNRHNKLSPSMSALIIRNHVKEGMELAKQEGIPQRVIDFIPQHHGTALIEYFYEKALKEAADGEVIDEMHYRYSGPKPQTKEAGILMLSDVVEAASRTIADPSPAKIQGMVQKIINKIFTSGQLDESELTLKDLHFIARSFTRVLLGIHHRRIEYSESAEKSRDQKADSLKAEIVVESTGTGELKSNGSRTTGEEDGLVQEQESRSEKENNGSGKDAIRRLGM